MPMPAARSESTAAIVSVRILRICRLWTRAPLAPGTARPWAPYGELDAADVAAVTRIDTDRVAGIDEQRNLHGRPGLELRRFRRSGRRVAFEARIRLGQLQLDVRRRFHTNRVAVVHLHVDL